MNNANPVGAQAYDPGEHFQVPPEPDVEAVNKLGGYNIAYDRLAIIDGQGTYTLPYSLTIISIVTTLSLQTIPGAATLRIALQRTLAQTQPYAPSSSSPVSAALTAYERNHG